MRMQVFDDAEDYNYFLELLKTGMEKEAVELHAYCLMPNHFHLLLVPQREGSLSRLMQWVMTSHVRYYHKKNKTSGHIWQGRYKSFMVEQESYYIALIRYIEANALRADLVERKHGSTALCTIAFQTIRHSSTSLPYPCRKRGRNTSTNRSTPMNSKRSATASTARPRLVNWHGRRKPR